MTPLTPDEALHAFMDGELDLTNEQSLFDELAVSPELRNEMKDALAIRDAVHQDLLAPPASAESGLLAGLGFTTGAGAGSAAAASAAASSSAGGSAWLSRTLYSVGGGVAGFLLAWMLFTDANNEISTTNVGNMATTGTVSTGPQPVDPVRVDTVYAVKYVAQRMTATPATTDESRIERAAAIQPPEEAPPTEEAVATIVQPEAIPYRTSSYDVTMRKADLMSPGTSAAPVTFRLRTLASGLSNAETIPASVQDAILPNTAYALLMPIGNGQRIGVEMGTESWQQTFSGSEDGRPVEITQTPVLFWMGATYQIQPMEFRFLEGLSPFADATLGVAFAQGPVGRATVGLAYQPYGPIRFTVGLDGSALMYQYQNAWFTSTKWGMSYGISFDIGALR
ncbi:MAG: hypothetical protein EHM43_09920 [Ignavibacteriae bacterium]|nr:MAG: hypothetical protein EHM43_09920 [Ignavibacteriota bacterium]